jgi:hypothetical protein
MFSKKNIKLCHEIVETKLQSFGMPCGGRCYDTDAHLCKKKFSIDADIEKKSRAKELELFEREVLV